MNSNKKQKPYEGKNKEPTLDTSNLLIENALLGSWAAVGSEMGQASRIVNTVRLVGTVPTRMTVEVEACALFA